MSNIQGNEQVRLARMEAVCNQLRSEMDDVVKGAYQAAVNDQDEERAAAMARKIRNNLLSISDAEFVFDRFGIELPETITAATMLTALKSFFNGLRTMLTGAWAVYRQSLRDLPNQEGFPFNIVWPEIPTNDVSNE